MIINGNLCDNIDNECLMAEGPGYVGDGGGGNGTSADWLLSSNYCRYSASRAYMIEAVQNVTIRDNEFGGQSDKAIGLDIGSTGATVAANKPVGIKTAVGMSPDLRQGYQEPPAPGRAVMPGPPDRRPVVATRLQAVSGAGGAPGWLDVRASRRPSQRRT